MDKLKLRSPEPDNSKDARQTSHDGVTSASAAGGEKARDLLQSTAASAARLGLSGLAAVKDACRELRNHTPRAAGEAGRAVRWISERMPDADRAVRWISERMPEAERRQQMLRVVKEVGTTAADVVVRESVRLVPGGPPLYQVIKKGVAEIAKIQREGAENASSDPPKADHPGGQHVADAVPQNAAERFPDEHQPGSASPSAGEIRRSRM